MKLMSSRNLMKTQVFMTYIYMTVCLQKASQTLTPYYWIFSDFPKESCIGLYKKETNPFYLGN